MDSEGDTIPEGSFRDGDQEVYISLYHVQQDTLGVLTPTLVLTENMTMIDVLDNLIGSASDLPDPTKTIAKNIDQINSDLTTQYTTTPIIVGKWSNYNVKRVSFSGSLTFGSGAGRHVANADLSSILTRNTRPISVKGFYNYIDTASREQIITIGSTNMSAGGLITDASLLRSIDSNNGYVLTFETYTSDSISQFSGHYDVTIEYIDIN
jgi:hypothetical protein